MGSPLDALLGGSGSSTSNATDSRTVATDQGRVFRGNVHQNTESGAVSIGDKATVQAAGSNNISGTLSKGSSLVINDPSTTLKALDTITALNKQNLDAQAAQAQASASALASALSSQAGAAPLLPAVTDSATAAAAAPAGSGHGALLWLGLAGLVLLVLVFFRRKL